MFLISLILAAMCLIKVFLLILRLHNGTLSRLYFPIHNTSRFHLLWTTIKRFVHPYFV